MKNEEKMDRDVVRKVVFMMVLSHVVLDSDSVLIYGRLKDPLTNHNKNHFNSTFLTLNSKKTSINNKAFNFVTEIEGLVTLYLTP
ncbi:hypothetical protein [Flammeovirga aprica]|uniref:Uncharacterized protein n=1 Tax=Flammeovirga aprica JL-4 TaxID=694437 RepID=A0A7X9RTC0_9BACT|nr:hypothetical protein [Flammeovirga aprica]NME68295.1 hypothetical protein [Flammeovirga aprica JL-4]